MHRIALIGSGSMGRVHARHWARMPDAKIVAIASLDGDTMAPLVAVTGAQAMTDAREAINRADVDIVDICVPTPLHKELAIESLGARKHTFLEKPMARTLAECDEIKRAHDASGVALTVGHVVRFFPEFRAAHDKVKAGGVGNVAAVRSGRLSGQPGGWHDWFRDPAQSGGVLLDLAIHDFDWMRWTFGEVDRVFAKGLHGGEYSGTLDYALVTLHFASGALGHVTASWAHPGGFRTQFEICGDNGMIEHDSRRSAPIVASLRATDTTAPSVTVPENPLAPNDDPYYIELRAFVDAIDSGCRPPVSVDDARAAVQIALAATESIQTGLPVSLP